MRLEQVGIVLNSAYAPNSMMWYGYKHSRGLISETNSYLGGDCILVIGWICRGLDKTSEVCLMDVQMKACETYTQVRHTNIHPFGIVEQTERHIVSMWFSDFVLLCLLNHP